MGMPDEEGTLHMDYYQSKHHFVYTETINSTKDHMVEGIRSNHTTKVHRLHKQELISPKMYQLKFNVNETEQYDCLT